jgi:hypothetical protein
METWEDNVILNRNGKIEVCQHTALDTANTKLILFSKEEVSETAS